MFLQKTNKVKKKNKEGNSKEKRKKRKKDRNVGEEVYDCALSVVVSREFDVSMFYYQSVIQEQ